MALMAVDEAVSNGPLIWWAVISKEPDWLGREMAPVGCCWLLFFSKAWLPNLAQAFFHLHWVHLE
jgi:hypothetical protein